MERSGKTTRFQDISRSRRHKTPEICAPWDQKIFSTHEARAGRKSWSKGARSFFELCPFFTRAEAPENTTITPFQQPLLGAARWGVYKKGYPKKYLVRARKWSGAEKRPVFRIFHAAGCTKRLKYALHGTRKFFSSHAAASYKNWCIVIFFGKLIVNILKIKKFIIKSPVNFPGKTDSQIRRFLLLRVCRFSYLWLM